MKSLFEKFLMAIFPRNCLSCGDEGKNICKTCRQKIEIKKWQACIECKRKNAFGEICLTGCSDGKFFSNLIVCCDYSLVMRKMMKLLKYRFSTDVVEVLADLLYKQYLSFSKQILELKRAYLVPVPISRKRKNFRGFNQVKLIIKEFISKSKNVLELKELDILEWKYYTRQQAGLSRVERIKNKENSVKTRGGVNVEKINGRATVIIDDIASTGSTLNACAKALHDAGFKNVFAFVIAKN